MTIVKHNFCEKTKHTRVRKISRAPGGLSNDTKI